MTVTKQKSSQAYNEVNKAYLKSEILKIKDFQGGSGESSGTEDSAESDNEGAQAPEPPQAGSSSSLLTTILNVPPLCDSSELVLSLTDLSCAPEVEHVELSSEDDSDNEEDDDIDEKVSSDDGENSHPGNVFCTEHIGNVLLHGNIFSNIFSYPVSETYFQKSSMT